MKKLAAIIGIVASAIAAPASAAQIFSLSYDMPNGSTGSYNYWDDTYNAPGAPITTDGAALTGGRGDLTDGVVAGGFWFNTEAPAGAGPYVGWLSSNTQPLAIRFAFGGAPTIDSIRIHIDNSNSGGVSQPGGYTVNGNVWTAAPLAPGSFGFVTLTGAPVTGNLLTLGMTYADGWIFASEVEFYGTAGTPGTTVVPLPAAAWLMLGGLGLIGGIGRRARRSA